MKTEGESYVGIRRGIYSSKERDPCLKLRPRPEATEYRVARAPEHRAATNEQGFHMKSVHGTNTGNMAITWQPHSWYQIVVGKRQMKTEGESYVGIKRGIYSSKERDLRSELRPRPEATAD
ncbi:hypothetical protein NDU88_010750 [Pleurodeles waltl]|uniref:Uncharacterized protein n=1 Tax=Pleurodeles waltl TaxID=8319 RepID=A0AAV7PZB1_PLEWA|nr:hypothetical protein NDU88_010750 [Pleurodeles waltl]